MVGILSQAMANVVLAEQHVQALGGLSPDAINIQSQMVASIGNIMPEIEQLQKIVLLYVDNAQRQIDEIENLLSDDVPLEVVIAQLQEDSSDVKVDVDSLTIKIVSVVDQVYGFANQLATVQSQLKLQIATLQSQLSGARGVEESNHKRYLYLLALGPFGLPGLATALGLYFKWKSDADNLEAQVNAGNLQVSRLEMMTVATNQLIDDFHDLGSKTTNMKNTIDFLANDIVTIITDAEQKDDRSVIELYIKAALCQVLTLKSDAS